MRQQQHGFQHNRKKGIKINEIFHVVSFHPSAKLCRPLCSFFLNDDIAK